MLESKKYKTEIRRYGDYHVLLIEISGAWCLCCNPSICWFDRECLESVVKKIRSGECGVKQCDDASCFVHGWESAARRLPITHQDWMEETFEKRKRKIDKGKLEHRVPLPKNKKEPFKMTSYFQENTKEISFLDAPVGTFVKLQRYGPGSVMCSLKVGPTEYWGEGEYVNLNGKITFLFFSCEATAAPEVLGDEP